MTTHINPVSRLYTAHAVRLRSLLAVRQHAVVKPLIREGLREMRDVKQAVSKSPITENQ